MTHLTKKKKLKQLNNKNQLIKHSNDIDLFKEFYFSSSTSASHPFTLGIQLST
jgi:hypothetical protein